MGYDGVDWIQLAQDGIQGLVNIEFHKRRRNFLTNWAIISLSRTTMHHGVSEEATDRISNKCLLVISDTTGVWKPGVTKLISINFMVQ
jgi:hypothetical protein